MKIGTAMASAAIAASAGLPWRDDTAEAAKASSLDPPILTCGCPSNTCSSPSVCTTNDPAHRIILQICAGASGAPAGFSVQWTKLPAGVDCNAFVWPDSSDPSVCSASFSGVPGTKGKPGSGWTLGAGQCVCVEIGHLDDSVIGVGLSGCGSDELDCGTTYVFRAFAHNDPVSGKGRSSFTPNLCCSTSPCPGECTCKTQGFWKTHGSTGDGTTACTNCHEGNNSDAWPSLTGQCTCTSGDGLCLGTTCYTKDQLCCILNTPSAGDGQPANGLIILAHQLITAKLNVLNGCTPESTVQAAISSADQMIGNLQIPPYGAGYLSPDSVSSLNNTLDNFNSHCETA